MSFDASRRFNQETLLKAWRSWDTFDGSLLFRAWLYKIATNVCLDMLRRSSPARRRCAPSPRYRGSSRIPAACWMRLLPARMSRITMPPNTRFLEGLDVIRPLLARIWGGPGRGLAPGSDSGQPNADGCELSPPSGRLRVPGIQVRCPAGRGRRHCGDHDVRRWAVPGFRAAGEALSTPSAGRCAEYAR